MEDVCVWDGRCVEGGEDVENVNDVWRVCGMCEWNMLGCVKCIRGMWKVWRVEG